MCLYYYIILADAGETQRSGPARSYGFDVYRSTSAAARPAAVYEVSCQNVLICYGQTETSLRTQMQISLNAVLCARLFFSFFSSNTNSLLSRCLRRAAAVQSNCCRGTHTATHQRRRRRRETRIKRKRKKQKRKEKKRLHACDVCRFDVSRSQCARVNRLRSTSCPLVRNALSFLVWPVAPFNVLFISLRSGTRFRKCQTVPK